MPARRRTPLTQIHYVAPAAHRRHGAAHRTGAAVPEGARRAARRRASSAAARGGRELVLALPLTLGALVIAVAVLLGARRLRPVAAHGRAQSARRNCCARPATRRSSRVVVVIAGGVREEVQRAFILRRFERWLGGATVGVVVASVGLRGRTRRCRARDAAIATALLGAFWGVVYLRRRSIVAPMVSHAAFDLLQVGLFFVVDADSGRAPRSGAEPPASADLAYASTIYTSMIGRAAPQSRASTRRPSSAAGRTPASARRHRAPRRAAGRRPSRVKTSACSR